MALWGTVGVMVVARIRETPLMAKVRLQTTFHMGSVPTLSKLTPPISTLEFSQLVPALAIMNRGLMDWLLALIDRPQTSSCPVALVAMQATTNESEG